MPTEITMPRLSDTMQQGTIVKWQVKEGQAVKSGDTIADIETDKATMELQSYDDGVVAKLGVAEGQTVPVGTVIMVLAGKGEDAGAIKTSSGAASGATAGAKSSGAVSATSSSTKASGAGVPPASPSSPMSSTALAEPPTNGADGSHGQDRVFVSPLARKIASESNINLGSIQGSGPGGRIVRRDVEAAIAGALGPSSLGTSALRADSPLPIPSAKPAATGRQGVGSESRPTPAPAPLTAAASQLEPRVVALSPMRRTIAKRLVESKTTIPHYQVTVEVDMDPLLALRQQLNDQLASQGVKLSVNDFLVRACALAMHQHPYVNSRWVGPAGNESVEILGQVNVGVAIALDESRGGGLVVATIRQADRIGLRQISASAKALADKARTKGLTLEEMADSTFTISNLGMFGVDHFTAIINPPNAAILAVGAAIEKPVVKNGQVVVGRVMSMTMSSDHRIVDGAMAAAYLNTVKGLLQAPATLLV